MQKETLEASRTSIPDYQSLMRPLLAFGLDGSEKNINDAIKSIADQLKLTEEERNQLLPSGKQPIFSNRLHWARTYLDKAGAIKRTRRSHFEITDRGKQLLADNPTRVDAKVLKQFPEFIAFQSPKAIDETGIGVAPSSATAATELPESAVTPEEAVQQAEAQIFENLKSQLLIRISELSPSFFERLVVDLVVAMGYGGSRASVIQRLGKSGDEGIDGIVNEDPLGLDVVYIQAKAIRSRQYDWARAHSAVRRCLGRTRRLKRRFRDDKFFFKRSNRVRY